MIRRFLGAAMASLLAGASAPALGEGWSLYIDFNFTAESFLIRDADRTKARRVADYVQGNPTLRVGLDGMNRQRVSSVREALIGAGVPPGKIQAGPFGEPRLRGERRVLVMVGADPH